jgi:hypothetical protein
MNLFELLKLTEEVKDVDRAISKGNQYNTEPEDVLRRLPVAALTYYNLIREDGKASTIPSLKLSLKYKDRLIDRYPWLKNADREYPEIWDRLITEVKKIEAKGMKEYKLHYKNRLVKS